MKEMNVKILLMTIVFVSVIGSTVPVFAGLAGSEDSSIKAIDIGELKHGY
jgi:hypothetical protein